jgi:hypothetical protein
MKTMTISFCMWGGLSLYPVLPGGRNFGRKAQKGPGKNKVWLEEYVANFLTEFCLVAEKGPKKIF